MTPRQRQAILAGRIEARIEALEAAYRAARDAATGAIATLADAGVVTPAELTEALRRGDFVGVRRGVRRLLGAREQAQRPARVPWVARLRGEARSREIALPEEVTRGLDALGGADCTVVRSAMRRAQAVGSAVSSALFRESAEHARAELAVARATDNLPEGAGPYNGQVLAARGSLGDGNPVARVRTRAHRGPRRPREHRSPAPAGAAEIGRSEQAEARQEETGRRHGSVSERAADSVRMADSPASDL